MQTQTKINFVADLLNLPGLRPDLQGPRTRGSTTQHGLEALDPFSRVTEFVPDPALSVPGARYFKFDATALDGLVGVVTFAEAVANPETRALLRTRDAGDHGVEFYLDVCPTEAEFRPATHGVAIVGPIDVPWGEKAFSAYLGGDRDTWRRYDACALIDDGARFAEFLVDQGDGDDFLDEQLQPQRLEAACARAGIPLTLRMQPPHEVVRELFSELDEHRRAQRALEMHKILGKPEQE